MTQWRSTSLARLGPWVHTAKQEEEKILRCGFIAHEFILIPIFLKKVLPYILNFENFN